MSNLKEHQNFFSSVKDEFKANCIKQGFCCRCKYKTISGDRLDCFERFYFDRIKKGNVLKTNK